MSKQEGIVRSHQTGNPDIPKWNAWWRSAKSPKDSPQSSSHQNQLEDTQLASPESPANGEASQQAFGEGEEQVDLK
jgi:hypothetical protein